MAHSKLQSILTVFTLVLIPVIFLFKCNSKNTSANDVFAATVPNEKEIRNNYLNYCAGCHGLNLERFDKNEWMFGNSDEIVISSIKFGREDIGMPAFKETFTDEQLKDLAQFVRLKVPKDDKDRKPAFTADQIINSKKQKFNFDTVVSGLDIPWGMEFLPNGDMLISERDGKLFRFSNNKLSEISGLPNIMVKGQGGLLDLRLHPDFSSNGWLYFSYSKPDDNDKKVGCTAIMRAKLSGNTLVNQELIFEGQPKTSRGHHWGSKLIFDKDGLLWFGIGDRGNRDVNPQSLANHCGKIHRINDDGSIPSDNPFVDIEGAMPSIYSFGHRNPQGTTMHPETGRIWASEHGPKGGDELNLIEKGLNYGWPVISYGINYSGTKFTDLTEKEGMEQPATYWVPSIAPCGMTFVTSDRYPAWKNHLLIGSLRFKYVERVELNGNEVVDQEKLLEGIGRVRNVEVSPDGFIYVALEKPGFIIKLLPIN